MSKGDQEMPTAIPPFKVGQPWYSNSEYYRAKASLYLGKKAPATEQDDDKLWAELASLMAFNRSRLVFESNLIESAGLPSEGETERLIAEYFPKLPGDPKQFASLLQGRSIEDLVSKGDLRRIRRDLRRAIGVPTQRRIIPSVSFAGRPRSYREVLQHYEAFDVAQVIALSWFIHATIVMAAKSIRKLGAEGASELLPELYKIAKVRAFRHRTLFSKTAIRKLHKTLATGLLPTDSGVPAGEYRIDNRTVGWEISFPAPENVASCMDGFAAHANELILDYFKNRNVSIFDVAAEVSYRFVRVHPFPDFNGRLSRVIMNMVLMLGGCLLPIAIRGDKKGKKRYFTALRHANGGRIETLGTLIAMSVVETHEEADENLVLAGVTPLIEMEDRDIDGASDET